ncbi:MAG TPA: hypothetical protein VFU90_08880 [Candidatus Tumulicola sp.]|nr:hypothetical protein [Candidatus Tumulicola sp.]
MNFVEENYYAVAPLIRDWLVAQVLLALFIGLVAIVMAIVRTKEGFKEERSRRSSRTGTFEP